MFGGIGEVLVNLISYPALIGSILIFAISLFFLTAKRKALKKEVRVLLIVLVIITAIVIGFIVFLVFAFGSNHPPAPPVPQPPTTNSGVEPARPNALVPSIMIEGTLYLMSQKEKPAIEIAESEYLGFITSTVRLSEWPTENGQANIDVEGAPYAEYGNGIVVLWNGEWTLFLTEQDRLLEVAADGSSGQTGTASDLLIIDEFEPIEGNALVFLGMLRLDAWDSLMAHISQDDVQGGNTFYSSIDDDYHNAHEFEGFSYNTDKNDALYIVTVNLERYQPTSGLRLGDTFARVIELYGSDYTEYTEDGSGFSKYEYIIGNHFFTVSFVDGTAYAWRVSSHSEQALRDAFIDNIRPGN